MDNKTNTYVLRCTTEIIRILRKRHGIDLLAVLCILIIDLYLLDRQRISIAAVNSLTDELRGSFCVVLWTKHKYSPSRWFFPLISLVAFVWRYPDSNQGGCTQISLFHIYITNPVNTHTHTRNKPTVEMYDQRYVHVLMLMLYLYWSSYTCKHVEKHNLNKTKNYIHIFSDSLNYVSIRRLHNWCIF